MSEKKINRTELVQVRLTKKEYDRIQSTFSRSTCRKLSEFIRLALLDKPVTVNNRNQSLDDFMGELILLRNELNAIGNNYNQVVKKLHTIRNHNELESWLVINDSIRKMFLEKVSEIKLKINQINDQWLQ